MGRQHIAHLDSSTDFALRIGEWLTRLLANQHGEVGLMVFQKPGGSSNQSTTRLDCGRFPGLEGFPR